MENLYKKTNFGTHPRLEPDEAMSDISVSNAIYDKHRNLTHGFVDEIQEDGTVMKRVVSDVELAMSHSDSVRAVVSAEYQEKLRLGLLNQPKSQPREGRMSDDDLISSLVPTGLEHDEAAIYAKSVLDKTRVSESLQNVQSPSPSETKPESLSE